MSKEKKKKYFTYYDLYKYSVIHTVNRCSKHKSLTWLQKNYLTRSQQEKDSIQHSYKPASVLALGLPCGAGTLQWYLPLPHIYCLNFCTTICKGRHSFVSFTIFSFFSPFLSIFVIGVLRFLKVSKNKKK